MSFMLKKKKYKFEVHLGLQELSAVPFVNGILFAKVRLIDGGTFQETSPRHEVKNNCVKWNCGFQFVCKMTANANTGVLEPCICKVSVRKEVRGGRSSEKLGFANLNLSEFAGAGVTLKRYLLEGYDAKHRQDNSMLHVSLKMVLQSGDPCFKTPVCNYPALLGDKPDSQSSTLPKQSGDYSGDSLASNSSGFGSLPRKQKINEVASDVPTVDLESAEEKFENEEYKSGNFELCHSRNNSNTSEQSKLSGYGSLTSHSRQGSAESGHRRNLSSSSTLSEILLSGSSKALDRKRPSKKQSSEDTRMDCTRVSANEVINEVMEAINLDPDENSETTGLSLSSLIRDTGSTIITRGQESTEFGATDFKPVSSIQR